jgi:hypothetical protein
LRVRTWRRLQDLGAVALKQAVYVLPDTPATREDFEWLKVDVEGAGGEATVLSGQTLDPAVDAALVATFTRARDEDYRALAAELTRVRRTASRSVRVQDRRRRDDLSRARERLSAIERIDFFGSPVRDRVVALIASIDAERESAGGRGNVVSSRPSAPRPGSRNDEGAAERARCRGRTWVTRPRPGIDRLSSAWLIRRFIDPDARFAFVTDPADAPDAIPFDMYGVPFSHEAGRCTFETLQRRFAIVDAAVSRLAAIVHDLDLRDDRFKASEAPTVGAAVEGLQLAHANDDRLMEQGIELFEALYRGFSRAGGAGRAGRAGGTGKAGKAGKA